MDIVVKSLRYKDIKLLKMFTSYTYYICRLTRRK